MGSSMVMMCSARVELMRSTIAARVVDLPDPVTPVTSTRPRGISQICSTILGRYSSSRARILVGITRSTSPTLPRCWNTFTRKRPRPATPYAMSISAVSLNFCFCRADIMLNAIVSMSSALMRGWSVSGTRSPSMRR